VWIAVDDPSRIADVFYAIHGKFNRESLPALPCSHLSMIGEKLLLVYPPRTIDQKALVMVSTHRNFSFASSGNGALT
jgi:hypothetical protein